MRRPSAFNLSVTVLDRVLLALIVGEPLYTLRFVVRTHEIAVEPFLYIGMIAVVRRILIVTAEFERGTHNGRALTNILLEFGLLGILAPALARRCLPRAPRPRGRLASAFRTAGATSVPNSSIARIIFACGIVPTLSCSEEAVVAEDLVLEEDLLDHLLRAADEVARRAASRAASNCSRVIGGQPRSRPIRFIIAANGGKRLVGAPPATCRRCSRAS